jgi:hypothetical protein
VILSSRAFQIAALSAFAAATLAVAGCGGSSSTPVAVASAGPTATATATATASGSGGSSNPTFTFTNAGGTANITAVTGGQTLTSGASAVGGVSVSSTWGTNTASSTVAMTAALATGSGDITPTSFPLFTVATAFDNTGAALTGTYTAVDYLKLTATPAATFSQTPGIVVTVGAPASLAGKTTCSYFSLNYSGTQPQWKQAISGTISGSTVTFTAQTLGGGNTVDVGNDAANTSAILALACK